MSYRASRKIINSDGTKNPVPIKFPCDQYSPRKRNPDRSRSRSREKSSIRDYDNVEFITPSSESNEEEFSKTYLPDFLEKEKVSRQKQKASMTKTKKKSTPSSLSYQPELEKINNIQKESPFDEAMYILSETVGCNLYKQVQPKNKPSSVNLNSTDILTKISQKNLQASLQVKQQKSSEVIEELTSPTTQASYSFESENKFNPLTVHFSVSNGSSSTEVSRRSLEPLFKPPEDLTSSMLSIPIKKKPSTENEKNPETIVIDDSPESKPIKPAQSKQEKLNLVIDLLGVFFDCFNCGESNGKDLKREFGSRLYHFKIGEDNIFVLKRGFSRAFLERISRYFNIFVCSNHNQEIVTKLLDIIDPDQVLIRRDIIYTNEQESTKDVPKSLSLLRLPNSHLLKTLILDLPYRWCLEEQPKILASKYFAPFIDFRSNKKNLKSAIIPDKSGKWLELGTSKEDLEFLVETSLDRGQLPCIEDMLVSIAKSWNRRTDGIYKIETLLVSKYQVLKGKKVRIVSAKEDRRQLFEHLSKKLGAEIVSSNDDAFPVCVDTEVVDDDLKSLKSWFFADTHHRKVSSVYWILECYYFFEDRKFIKYYF